MELSISAILVGILTKIGLTQRPFQGGGTYHLVVYNLAPLAKSHVIVRTNARELRSTGDVQKYVFDLHVVLEQHLFDRSFVFLLLDHDGELAVLQILFQHLLQVFICVLRKIVEHR